MAADSNGRTALTASALLLGGALVLSLVLGTSMLGVLMAAGAAVPAGYAMWQGMQQQTQKTSAYAILLLLGSLGAAAVLLIIWIIRWLR